MCVRGNTSQKAPKNHKKALKSGKKLGLTLKSSSFVDKATIWRTKAIAISLGEQ